MSEEDATIAASSSMPAEVQGEQSKAERPAERAITRQVEYYFRPRICSLDEFLEVEVAKDEDGWAGLAEIAELSRVRSSVPSGGTSAIAGALRSSSWLLEVSEDGARARVRPEVLQEWARKSDARRRSRRGLAIKMASYTARCSSGRLRTWVRDFPCAQFIRGLNQPLYLIEERDDPCLADKELDAQLLEQAAGEAPPPPPRLFVLLGSTGNVYTVRVGRLVSCDCGDAENARSRVCKHALFVFLRVLQVGKTSPLVFQTALLPSELRAIFTDRPAVKEEVLASRAVMMAYAAAVGQTPTCRGKEADDCAVCLEPLEPQQRMEVCATCANGICTGCLRRLKKAKRRGAVPCPFCRAVSRFPMGSSSGRVCEQGYLNFAAEIGLSEQERKARVLLQSMPLVWEMDSDPDD